MQEDWYNAFADEFWLEPDDGSEDAVFIANALQLKPGSQVLDAPCGNGRIAVHLARAGCSVTGLDSNKKFVRLAREQVALDGNSGVFTCKDLREMNFADSFDAACNWAGSFGYFSDTQNQDLICRYQRSLRSGGLLLVEQANREVLLRGVSDGKSGRPSGKPIWDKPTNRLHLNLDAKHRHPSNKSRLSIRLYTAGELLNLFKAAGLTVLDMYGSNRGEPYARSSKHLIVLGRKA